MPKHRGLDQNSLSSQNSCCWPAALVWKIHMNMTEILTVLCVDFSFSRFLGCRFNLLYNIRKYWSGLERCYIPVMIRWVGGLKKDLICERPPTVTVVSLYKIQILFCCIVSNSNGMFGCLAPNENVNQIKSVTIMCLCFCRFGYKC